MAQIISAVMELRTRVGNRSALINSLSKTVRMHALDSPPFQKLINRLCCREAAPLSSSKVRPPRNSSRI